MAARTASRQKRRTSKTSGPAKRKTSKSASRAAKSTRARSPRRPASRRRTSATARSRSSRSRAASKDMIALLKEDHREVDQMFRRYARLGAGAKKSKQTIVRDVIKELSKHAAVEEELLYPTLRREVPGGEKFMDEGIEEHQRVKELLAALDKMTPEDDDYEENIESLMGEVRHHVSEEEGEIFPKLRKALSRDRLVQLGQLMEVAKKAAPTRPHPHMPARPPMNVVTGAVAGVVDRVRDAGRNVMNG